jgi:pentapeptide MXKDX repeat protein
MEGLFTEQFILTIACLLFVTFLNKSILTENFEVTEEDVIRNYESNLDEAEEDEMEEDEMEEDEMEEDEMEEDEAEEDEMEEDEAEEDEMEDIV